MLAIKTRFQNCPDAEIELERDYLDTMRTIRSLAEQDSQNAAPNVPAPLEQYEDVLAGGPGSRPPGRRGQRQ